MSLLTSALNFVPMFALSWLFLFEASRRRTPTAALFAGYFQIVLVLTALVMITTFRFIPADPGWLSACLIGVAAIAAIEVGRIAKNPASSAPGEPRANVAHLEDTGGAWFTPRFHSAKEIAAPIETVFRYLADPALWNEWSIIPMEVTRTSDGDWGQGTTYRQTFRAQGRQYSQTAEILRFEPPFLIDERCATNEVWAANATTRLSRTPSGNTRVELSCAQTALTPKRRVLLRLFWPFFLLSSVWMLDRNLKKLRRVIESGDSALQAQRVRAARIGWVATGVAILATLHLPWTLPVVGLWLLRQSPVRRPATSRDHAAAGRPGDLAECDSRLRSSEVWAPGLRIGRRAVSLHSDHRGCVPSVLRSLAQRWPVRRRNL